MGPGAGRSSLCPPETGKIRTQPGLAVGHDDATGLHHPAGHSHRSSSCCRPLPHVRVHRRYSKCGLGRAGECTSFPGGTPLKGAYSRMVQSHTVFRKTALFPFSSQSPHRLWHQTGLQGPGQRWIHTAASTPRAKSPSLPSPGLITAQVRSLPPSLDLPLSGRHSAPAPTSHIQTPAQFSLGSSFILNQYRQHTSLSPCQNSLSVSLFYI